MHQPEFQSPIPRPVTIDVDGEPQGILVPALEGVRFVAVRLGAFSQDGAEFDSIEAEQLAIVEAVRNFEDDPLA